MRKCNRCNENEAVADWGVCWKCFQKETDEWIEETLSGNNE